MSKARDTSWARFIVLTGLSGSGKSQAIRALEDLGYYCVDNLPVSLLPVMAELAERQTEHNRVAVVMDIREPRFVSDFPRAYRKLKTNKHLHSKMIFLEAGHAEIDVDRTEVHLRAAAIEKAAGGVEDGLEAVGGGEPLICALAVAANAEFRGGRTRLGRSG